MVWTVRETLIQVRAGQYTVISGIAAMFSQCFCIFIKMPSMCRCRFHSVILELKHNRIDSFD